MQVAPLVWLAVKKISPRAARLICENPGPITSATFSLRARAICGAAGPANWPTGGTCGRICVFIFKTHPDAHTPHIQM